MTLGGRSWRRLALLSLGASLLLLIGPPASAHSELERSDPADGSTVDEGRTTVSLWFTEPVDPATSTFDLEALNGSTVCSRAANARR